MSSFRTITAAALVAACAVALTGCSLPSVHRITIQQGNIVSQGMVDRLKPGMTRSQVAYIMGEPVLRNTFDEDRWDYVYTVEVPGYFSEQRRVSLFFEDDLLSYFTGDMAPQDVLDAVEPEA